MKKFWTKTGKFFSLLLATCAAFTACTDDTEDFRQSAGKALDIQVAVKPTSRAMVMGTALPEGAKIGVNVTATDGGEYDGQNTGYLNVPYTATGTGTSQTWGSTAPVMLSGTEGKMYAYFPYTQGIDYTAVEVDIADQHDWMYGTEAYSVSDKAPSADVVLAHAQTALNINVVRDNAYTGAGLVETLAITSEGLASTGTLDTRDGSWTAQAGANTAISIISAPFTLDGTTLSNQENPYMFIPASDETKDFTVTATVDGKAYNVGVAMNEAFAPGKMYQLNVKVTNTGLTVSKVTLTDWVIDTTLPDAEFAPEQSDTQEPYADWVKATYNVTDNSTVTQIFGSTSSFDIASVAEMAVLENGGSRAVAEPVVVTPAKTYQFTTTGTHTVYVKFTDMTQIPEHAFEWCKELKEITIPNSVTSIGEKAFYQCSGLTEAIIGEAVQTIGEKVFNGCTGLITITIPNSVTTIGDMAFYECEGLTEVTIGSGVETIGEYAFYDCEGLTTITIPNSVTTIGESAFLSCEGLKEVVISNSVETIGPAAFMGCTGLTGTLTIPESVTEIGVGAFSGCSELTEVTIGSAVQTIGEAAFYQCTGLTSVTIPNSVQTIGDMAFYDCEGLTEVTIGSGVETIGEQAFEWCSGLTNMVVMDGNTVYDSRNNCNAIMESATNTLVLGCKNTVIPQDCKVINSVAFMGCTGLTGTLTIPNSVQTIGEKAFEGCEGLVSLNLGEGVQTIGEAAFQGCAGLTGELVIPNSVTSIGGQAFSSCSELTSVTIGSAVQTIGGNAFVWCTKLNSITSLATTAPSIESYTFYNVAKNGMLYIPTGTTGYETWMQNTSGYLGYYNWTIQEITGE